MKFKSTCTNICIGNWRSKHANLCTTCALARMGCTHTRRWCAAQQAQQAHGRRFVDTIDPHLESVQAWGPAKHDIMLLATSRSCSGIHSPSGQRVAIEFNDEKQFTGIISAMGSRHVSQWWAASDQIAQGMRILNCSCQWRGCSSHSRQRTCQAMRRLGKVADWTLSPSKQ